MIPIKLLVNADDLGLSSGVNFGIQEAYQNGIVRSASLMATGDGFVHAVSVAKRNPGLGVGVHLTLTYGKPVGPRPDTLTDENGCFLKKDALTKHCSSLDPRQVGREFEAQIQKVLDSGIHPTHLDSHHHIHRLAPIKPIFLRLAKAYRLPVRLPRQGEELPPGFDELDRPPMLVDSFHGARATIQHLLDILHSHKDSDRVIQITTHPGYVDRELYQNSSYHMARAEELRVLIHSEIKRCIESNHISLISFQQLASRGTSSCSHIFYPAITIER